VSHRMTDALSAAMTQKVLIKDSPPTAPTTGSLYVPMQDGETIDGGVRKRLAEGDLQKVEQPAPAP
jgi:hypothetical protein